MTLIHRTFLMVAVVLAFVAPVHAATPDGKKKIVIIAGKPSHPPRMHEFRAGSLLLQKCLANVPNLIVEVGEMGWVTDDKTLDDADAIIIYADGGEKHPAMQPGHLEKIEALAAKGVGLGMLHYGVTVPVGPGGDVYKRLMGGHYEEDFSCNPLWSPAFEPLPQHPITRGVKPFTVNDEWYFNLRFADAFAPGNKPATDRDGTKFLPILVAKPTDATRNGPYVHPKGPYPHIIADRGRAETMMWCVERPDGGRSFGFTGAHFHDNWGNDDFRRIVLNALLWVAKADVPANGVESTVTKDELNQNLDPKPQKKPAATPAAK
jgi:hypothetical protein